MGKLTKQKKHFEKVQNHLKETGYIFKGSEIYGGLANTYDYGPLGVVLSQNIKNWWWNEFINKIPNNFGFDGKILLNSKVWETSGHIKNFIDLLVENKVNGKRYRIDHLIEKIDKKINVKNMTQEEIILYLKKNVKKLDGDNTDWSDIKNFNLMFKTHQGAVDNLKTLVYLRPELAQGIFINFNNIQKVTRSKIPFGIGQIGKSFRNEVTPGNYIFRTREFEQMELEYFVEKKDADKTYKEYIDKALDFILDLGIKKESIRIKKHPQEKLAHYANATSDIEFNFSFGWGEIVGISNRGDFDLKNHQIKSGENLYYLDPKTNKKIIPYVIEPSMGVDRIMLAVLIDAYQVEKLENDERIVLKLNKNLAPYQVAVLPLNKKYHSKTAKKIFEMLIKKGLRIIFDETGSIGKRYRRQDAIGTPLCLTIIDETSEKNQATIRYRDNMKQIKINIDNLNEYL